MAQTNAASLIASVIFLSMVTAGVHGRAHCPYEIKGTEYLGIRINASGTEVHTTKCVTLVNKEDFEVMSWTYLGLYNLKCHQLFGGAVHRMTAKHFSMIQSRYTAKDAYPLSVYSGYEMIDDSFTTTVYRKHNMPQQFPACLKNAAAAKCHDYKLLYIETTGEEKFEFAHFCYAADNATCTYAHEFFVGCSDNISKCIQNGDMPLCRTLKQQKSSERILIDGCQKQKWNYFACIHKPLKKCALESTPQCRYDITEGLCTIREQKSIRKLEERNLCITSNSVKCKCNCSENQWSLWKEDCAAMSRKRYRAFNGLPNSVCLNNLSFCCNETSKLSNCSKDANEDSPCKNGIRLTGTSGIAFCECEAGYSGPTCSELHGSSSAEETLQRMNVMAIRRNARKRREAPSEASTMNDTVYSGSNDTVVVSTVYSGSNDTVYSGSNETDVFASNGTVYGGSNDTVYSGLNETGVFASNDTVYSGSNDTVVVSTVYNGSTTSTAPTTTTSTVRRTTTSTVRKTTTSTVRKTTTSTVRTTTTSTVSSTSPRAVPGPSDDDEESSGESAKEKSSVGLIAGVLTAVILLILLFTIIMKNRAKPKLEAKKPPSIPDVKSQPPSPVPIAEAVPVMQTALGDIDGPQSLSLASEAPSISDQGEAQ